jgi:uncharacterized membrane protein
MTILKYILYAITAIAALLLVVAFFINSAFRVESEIIINQPKHVVFDYIKHLKNQEQYSKWMQMDPDVKINYQGEDGTVGFVHAWESEMQDVGVGEQEITSIVEGERVETEIRFMEPFVSTDQSYMMTESINGGSTKVIFGYNGKMNYPTNLLIPVFKNKIGNDMDENLQALKFLLEEN